MRRRRTMSGFLDDIGTFMGNLGNNWAGGEDQAMYADPNSTMENPGGATAAGVQNFDTAVASEIPSLPSKNTVLLILGGAIIVFSLVNDR
jgi:hypothetical protein